ncbi:hypothetical protein RCL1_006193 [Eukaryota sp. TZLM3-RCL]
MPSLGLELDPERLNKELMPILQLLKRNSILEPEKPPSKLQALGWERSTILRAKTLYSQTITPLSELEEIDNPMNLTVSDKEIECELQDTVDLNLAAEAHHWLVKTPTELVKIPNETFKFFLRNRLYVKSQELQCCSNTNLYHPVNCQSKSANRINRHNKILDYIVKWSGAINLDQSDPTALRGDLLIGRDAYDRTIVGGEGLLNETVRKAVNKKKSKYTPLVDSGQYGSFTALVAYASGGLH